MIHPPSTATRYAGPTFANIDSPVRSPGVMMLAQSTARRARRGGAEEKRVSQIHAVFHSVPSGALRSAVSREYGSERCAVHWMPSHQRIAPGP